MCKLLIVEDEPLIRAGLKQYFEWEELGVHTIIEAENGEDGVKTALLEHPDLVITDIRMPVMDGLEMIGQLRSKLPNTLFIILTGHNEFDYARKAIQYGGVYDYLLKPLQYDESYTVILSCIEKIKEQQKTSQVLDRTSAVDLQKGIKLLEETGNNQELQLFKQIEAYIQQHMEEEITLNRVAEHFFYNPSYLSRLFKVKLNKNYMTFVSEIRINQALQYLELTQYSVSDVSTMCGYKSYKHFIKVFKNITEMTPTEYRKKLRL